MRAATDPRLTTNAIQNIAEATEDAPILFQVVFHPDKPTFTPPIITDWAGWLTLPAGAGAALADHMLTETAAPDTSTPAAIRSGKTIQTSHNQRTVQMLHPD